MAAEWDTLTPFTPLVARDHHATVAFFLMAIGLTLTGMFSLNKSAVAAPVLAIPASACMAFGAVFLICAAGVYV